MKTHSFNLLYNHAYSINNAFLRRKVIEKTFFRPVVFIGTPLEESPFIVEGKGDAYVETNLMFAFGKVDGILPCLGKTSIKKSSIVQELLKGVLVATNDTGTLLRPRHRVIAFQIAEKIAPLSVKVEALTAFLKQISSDIVPNAIRRRAPVYTAYRGLINSNGLKRLLNGDHQVILGLYEELEDYYSEHFLFWLHYAMAYMDRGDLDIADNYLQQAFAICEKVGADPFQIQHQKGILYLTQAARMSPHIGRERANEGIDILLSLIRRRGDTDAYPYGGYMSYVLRWYVHAKDLITDGEWESLRSLAREATNKYRLDDELREVSNQIERGYLLRVATAMMWTAMSR